MFTNYSPQTIEPGWQHSWEQAGLYRAVESAGQFAVGHGVHPRLTTEPMVLLAPAAPHIREALWHETGHSGIVHRQPWPSWDETLSEDEIFEIQGIRMDRE